MTLGLSAGGALLLYLVFGRPGEEVEGFAFVDALLIAGACTAFLRSVATCRRIERTSPVSRIDSAPPQPGENRVDAAAGRGSGGSYSLRLARYAGVVRKAAIDPEYFRATFVPLIEGLRTEPRSETADSPELEPVRRSRLWPERWSTARRRNIRKIVDYVLLPED
jgi:hypothetical protein